MVVIVVDARREREPRCCGVKEASLMSTRASLMRMIGVGQCIGNCLFVSMFVCVEIVRELAVNSAVHCR